MSKSFFFLLSLCLWLCVLGGCEKRLPEPTVPAPATEPATAGEEAIEVDESILEQIRKSFGTFEKDARGRVVAVDLAGGRTSVDDATLSEVLRLPDLKKLSLSGTGLSSETLRKIENLQFLEELFLQDTPTTDEEIVRLVKKRLALKRLRLRRLPHVGDRGITALAGLRELRVLALLEMPGLTTVGLAAIVEVPSVRSLDLRGNANLKADDYGLLREMKGLTELKIGGFSIDDSVLEVVVALPELNSLTIEDAKFSPEKLTALFENESFARRIKTLGFSRMLGSVNDRTLAELKRFPNLRHLLLKQILINGSFLSELKMPLETLTLDRAMLKPQAFEEIARMTSLKKLNLSGVFLSAEAIERIASLPHLESLDLSGCMLRGEMLAPLKNRPQLQELNLEGNPELGEIGASREP